MNKYLLATGLLVLLGCQLGSAAPEKLEVSDEEEMAGLGPNVSSDKLDLSEYCLGTRNLILDEINALPTGALSDVFKALFVTTNKGGIARFGLAQLSGAGEQDLSRLELSKMRKEHGVSGTQAAAKMACELNEKHVKLIVDEFKQFRGIDNPKRAIVLDGIPCLTTKRVLSMNSICHSIFDSDEGNQFFAQLWEA